MEVCWVGLPRVPNGLCILAGVVKVLAGRKAACGYDYEQRTERFCDRLGTSFPSMPSEHVTLLLFPPGHAKMLGLLLKIKNIKMFCLSRFFNMPTQNIGLRLISPGFLR